VLKIDGMQEVFAKYWYTSLLTKNSAAQKEGPKTKMKLNSDLLFNLELKDNLECGLRFPMKGNELIFLQ